MQRKGGNLPYKHAAVPWVSDVQISFEFIDDISL